MNCKGQIDIPFISFFVLVIGLLIIGPVVLKIFNSVQDTVGPQLGNVTMGGEEGKAAFNKVMDTAVNFWDKVIISAFFLGLILLFISSFLIDTHPFWIFLYIFIAFMFVLFAPSIVDSLGGLWDSSEFIAETSQLTMLNSIRTNFGVFIVGIIIITGIIIYAKVALIAKKGVGRK